MAGLVLVACASGDEVAAPRALVEAAAWVPVEGDEDPFADEVPGVACDPIGLGLEDFGGEQAFHVLTARCPRVTLVQPALTDAWAGEALFVRLWHYDLTAPEPAETVLALAVDGLEVWREVVPIPATSAVVLGEARLPLPVAPGAPVAFHLHNHGANAWEILEISVGGQP